MSETAPMDAATAHALDLFSVPPPDAGFGDRVVQAALWRGAPTAVARSGAAGRRRRWARRTMAGVIALGLASATAAAGGVFGPITNPFPVVTRMIAPPPAAPPVAQVRPRRAKAVAAKRVAPPGPVVSQTPAPPRPTLERLAAMPRPVRRVVVARMVTRIQRGLYARGIAVPRAVIRARLIERLGDSNRPVPPRFDRVLTAIEGRLAEQARSPTGGAELTPPLPPSAQDAWAAQRARWRYWRMQRWLRTHRGRGAWSAAMPPQPTNDSVGSAAVPVGAAPPVNPPASVPAPAPVPAEAPEAEPQPQLDQ